MLFRSIYSRALLAALSTLLVSGPVSAEDIDIFSANNVTTDLPNVILLLDNSANWTTNLPVPDCYYKDGGVTTTDGPKFSNPNKEQGKKMALQKCALYNVIDSLPVKTTGGPNADGLFNISIMLLNESPASNAGGYPRKAFTTLTTANKNAFKAIIKGLEINGDKGNNASFSKALYEAYLYYAGVVPYKGNAGTKWDNAAVSGDRYVSPAASSCARNFVILIANGSPESSENGDSLALLTAKGGNVTPIAYPTGYVSNPDQSNWADEMARFMVGQDVSDKTDVQSITTYTISITGASSDGTYPNFMDGVAKAGGGDAYQASTLDALTKALNDVFNQIQAVNSVFASAALPVSVSARGSYLNQVYMGVFRPDGNALPRWSGNLKQYKFNYNPTTDALSLFDAAGSAAVSAVTGFISPSVVSFWTKPSTFWANNPLGTPKIASDSPDGEVVEKGGVAQQIRTSYATSQSDRNVYTCVDCLASVVDLTGVAQSFDAANNAVTAAMLGVTSVDRSNLMKWIRGADNVPMDESGPGGTTTVRPSVHGDVLHSRPLALNYNTGGVVVFYGSNDGSLRAINGDQTGVNAGKELWSFIPEEHFGKFNRLRVNSPKVRLSTTPASSALPRDYFVDGPIAAYQKFNGAAVDKAHLYFGMRRGGRVLYSLDVSNPQAPKFRWKKTPADLTWTVASTTYALGQTWSEPKIAAVKIAGVKTNVLIMGGGYDAVAEDSATPGTTTMGNAVLVLNAETGALIKVFPTARSVPADVTLIDADKDGLIDRVYAVDIGGNVYRIDLGIAGNSAVSTWGMYQLASLGGGGTRKFFFGPDVVLTKGFAAVITGSGDREKPLNTTVAGTDRFFTVLDRNLDRGTPVSPPGAILSTGLGQVGTGEDKLNGCYIPMAASEKIVNAPVTVEGSTYFGTNKPIAPSPNTCSSNLGQAKVYAAPAFCKAASSSTLTGGGLPPSPVTGIVNVSYTLPDGTTATKDVKYIIGAPNDKNSAVEVKKVETTGTGTTTRRRLYWFAEGAR